MNELNLRILTALPLILIGFIIIYLYPNLLIYLVSTIFIIINIEWNLIFFKRLNFLIFLQIFLIILFQIFFENLFFSIIIFSIYFTLIYFIYYYNKFKLIYLITLLYFFLSLASIFSLINIIDNFNIIYFIIINVILFDSFSYIFGKTFKSKKILPKISPGKSISGYLLGILFTFIIIYLLKDFLSIIKNIHNLSLHITIIIFSAIIGDIIESIIKRNLSLKDISNFLPGHGGFFDRFDSFLFVFIIINIFYQINYLL
tara:strand:+ start:94 stop:867 length:774 start_codon:yes stop_codon:yes gene_type:complete